jgi:hypothetical protein
MTFQNPAALAWTLPAIAALVVLYLLRIKRQQRVVPASFLWPSVQEDVRANSLFQKPRFTWLFLLQLLALLVLGVVLARPQRQDSGLLGSATVFVIDASQSMGATDVKPSRLAVAVEEVRQAVQKMQPADQVAVIEASSSPRVVSALSNDPSQHLAALNTVRASDTAGHMGEALRLASALVSADEGGRIVLVSDGCFDPIADFSPGKASIVFRQVGTDAPNLGIEAINAADTKDGRLLYVGVHDYGKTGLTAKLEIYADQAKIDTSDLGVEPGKTTGKTVGVPSNAKVYQARLVTEDALASDNYAACAAPGTGQVKALLVSSGDLFLEKALSLDPRVTLDRATKLPVNGGADYDLVVLDDVIASPKSRYVLSLGAPSGALTPAGAASTASYVSTTPDALTEGVEFSGFGLGELPRTTLKSGKSLLETSQGPALAVANLGGQTWIASSIAPLRSDFPLSVSFPIFIGNVLDLVAQRPSSEALAVSTGQTFSLPAKQAVQLLSPDGKPQTLQPEGQQVVVREVNRTGVWTLKSAGKEIPIYASSLSAADSDLTPRTSLQLGKIDTKKLAQGSRSADWWKPFLLACVGVLGLEWWLFVRKS